jgi:hypothetical protein
MELPRRFAPRNDEREQIRFGWNRPPPLAPSITQKASKNFQKFPPRLPKTSENRRFLSDSRQKLQEKN